mmetsp:Transcript_87287/g.154674  ORF Transcript_87287/g.154674 Transcript_87287/m.154674 type:complete len:1085 (-) Transcript_87287:90-3344(-)
MKDTGEKTLQPPGHDSRSTSRAASLTPDYVAIVGDRKDTQPKAATQGLDFRERIATLLTMEDGARILALKLYSRFKGSPSGMMPVLKLFEDHWGFPGRLLPLLWTQLRRAVFRRRGSEVHLQRFGDFEAPERVEEDEWVEAFVRWLEGLHVRCGKGKVSRRSLVRRHTRNSDPTEECYLEGPKIGEGAYGEVYVMFHKSLRVQRAVKKIRKAQLSVAAEKAEDEVNVLRTLDHPHIVRIYEAFERQDTLHVVMDWAEGGTLAALLEAELAVKRTLTEPWACTAVHQMCAALEYMHHKGVIHCDLKTENCMLLQSIEPSRGEAPHIVLVDFGIAELVEDRSPIHSGQCRGTPLYLSPEAFEGHLTEKSDLWALGVITFEMLLARRPFQGDTVLRLMCSVMQSEPSLDGLSPLAQEVVQGLLSKDPLARLTAQECRSLGWFATSNQLPPAESQAKIQNLGRANFFHRVAMFAVATGLSMKEMQDVFQVFQSIDLDRSGYLSFDQFAEGLKQLNISEDPQELMAILDMDQNGRISYTEFLAGVLGSIAEDLPEKLVREAFDVFDLDGDGVISLSELRLMLSGDGPLVEMLPSGQTVDEVMEEVGDGKDCITFQDFLEYLAASPRSNRPAMGSKEDQARDLLSDMIQDVDSSGAVEGSLEASHAEAENLEEKLHEQTQVFEDKQVPVSFEDHSDEENDEAAFWRAWSQQSRQVWGVQRPGREDAEPRLEDLPPFHRVLHEAVGDPSKTRDQLHALKHLLAFPQQPLTWEVSDNLAEHLSGLSRHFMGCLALVRLLAEGRHVDIPAEAFQERKGKEWSQLERELEEALKGTAAAEVIKAGMVSPQVRRLAAAQDKPATLATRSAAVQVDLVATASLSPRPPSVAMSAGPPLEPSEFAPSVLEAKEAAHKPTVRSPLPPQKPWGAPAAPTLDRRQRQESQEQYRSENQQKQQQRQQQQQQRKQEPAVRQKRKKVSQPPRPLGDNILTSPGRSSNATPEVHAAMPRSESHKLPFTVEEDPFLSELKLLREKAKRLPLRGRAAAQSELVSLPRLFPPKPSPQWSNAAPKPVRSRQNLSSLPMPSQLRLPPAV